jgi:hypothetical protein
LLLALVIEKGLSEADRVVSEVGRAAGFITTMTAEVMALLVVADVWRPTEGVGQVCGGLMLLATSQMVITLAGGVTFDEKGDPRPGNWSALASWGLSSTAGLSLIAIGLFF